VLCEKNETRFALLIQLCDFYKNDLIRNFVNES
jgi:hypothetical protein